MNPLVSVCIVAIAISVAASAVYPSRQFIPLLYADQEFEESSYNPQAIRPDNDLQVAASGHDHHLARVQIKVYRGPDSHHGHEHFAPHGFWVKQPADEHHHY